MRGKSVALLVLALGCGLVAALGITQILARRSDTPQVETVPVIVAGTEIPPNTLITNEMVKSQDWPKDRVPAGAIVRTEDIVGRFAKGRVFGDELIIEPKLLPRGEHPADSAIPKGFRVVTVAVEVVSTNGGLVLPNSRVDLQLHVKRGQDPSIGETMTQTILQDVRVFAVNDVLSAETPDKKGNVTSIPGRTVSLLVTPQQAGIVTAASELGTIRMIMRGLDDRSIEKLPPVTPRGMMGLSDNVNRDMELKDKDKDKDDGFTDMYETLQRKLKLAADQKGAPPEPTRWSVRMISAGNVSDVVLQTFDKPDDAVWSARGLPDRPRTPPPALAAAGASPGQSPPGMGLPNTPLGPPSNDTTPGGSGPSSSGKNNLFRPSSPSP